MKIRFVHWLLALVSLPVLGCQGPSRIQRAQVHLQSAYSLLYVARHHYSPRPVPEMAAWQHAVANCRQQVVNLAFLTDSYGMAAAYNGGGAFNPDNRYPSHVRLALQKVCPSHGTGLHPFVQQLSNGTPHPIGDSRYYRVTAGEVNQKSDLGPAQIFLGQYRGSVITAPVGTRIVFSADQDHIQTDAVNTYCETGPGFGNWQVSEGGRVLGTCGGSTLSVQAAMSRTRLGSLALHRVEFTCAQGPCSLYGAEGTAGDVGVSVHPIALASSSAESYNPPQSTAFLDLIPGRLQGVVINFGTNEAPELFSVASFQAALTNIIQHERPASILLLTSPVSANYGGNTMPSYAQGELDLGRREHVAVANVQDVWGTQYVPVYFGPDHVHPSDGGDVDMARLLEAYLLPSRR